MSQSDLLPDQTVSGLLPQLIELATAARAGEIEDNPTQFLTVKVTKAACSLAGRGSRVDAQALLDLLADDIPRGENQYRHHDEEHVQACLEIASHHPELAMNAFERLFDLAEAGTHYALKALPSNEVVESLTVGAGHPVHSGLSDSQKEALRDRLEALAANGKYDAGIAVAALGGSD